MQRILLTDREKNNSELFSEVFIFKQRILLLGEKVRDEKIFLSEC
jgi:hypothetical protein